MRVNRDDIIELDDFLPYQLILLADRVSRRSGAIVKRFRDMNLSQWRVLAAVAEAEGRTANEVVAVTPMDKGLVSRAVKSLIERRLIERRASDSDGRVGHLHLTRRGARLYREIAHDVRAMETEMLAALDPADASSLQASLRELLDTLSD
ncbi:MarR family winged helix-turn-helix transcriptional regulator [Sphingomicrobium clamense]|uniref:MarR family winged helix-turn-helix transcriptional regulator n=1 Tax=Sphingomicrobium clamense TaxID=2851013 RepID=A0ABS6V3L1_9SPHN|nr:MarR family transcriptional regulator [Sphingomicrobium sp. B8]MBW0144141.1 MarR family winged helix-turn-helix transcriptional regulator [Sphingomicrobium sp. B8]